MNKFLLYMLVLTHDGDVTDLLLELLLHFKKSLRSRVEMTLFTLAFTCSSEAES